MTFLSIALLPLLIGGLIPLVVSLRNSVNFRLFKRSILFVLITGYPLLIILIGTSTIQSSRSQAKIYATATAYQANYTGTATATMATATAVTKLNPTYKTRLPGVACDKLGATWTTLVHTDVACLQGATRVTINAAASANDFNGIGLVSVPNSSFGLQSTISVTVSDLQTTSSVSAGIFLETVEGDNLYGFDIDQNGKWGLGLYGADGTGILIYGGTVPRNFSYNITVIINSEQITAFVNNNFIFKTQQGLSTKGYIPKLIISGEKNSSVNFSNFSYFSRVSP